MSSYTPTRVRIRKLLYATLPIGLYRVIQRVWIVTMARFYSVQPIVDHYTELFLAEHPRVVHGGPFLGMQYVDQAVGSNYLHKLIGSYEAVLHPVIKSLASKEFDTIVDIGSAEGYYLIGLGRMFPRAKLVGFEMESKGHVLTRELYERNKLSNELVQLGEATSETIPPFLTNHTLLICDCEGAELTILDPDRVSSLYKVEIMIIELHDFICPGIKESLLQRFSSTHDITVIPFKMASPESFPFLASISNKGHQYELLRERGWQEQEWLVMVKK